MQILNNFPKLTDFQRLNLIKIAKSNTNLLDSSRFKHVYPDSINIVDSRPNIPVFDILKGISDQIKKDYNLSSKFTLLVLKPQITPSFFPPHNDGARNLGINYVLNTGGDNVITRFYNKPGSYTKDDRMYWNEASLEKNFRIYL